MALGSRKRRKTSSNLSLNITSMMDMFTIILIFLLFSYGNEPEIKDFDKNLRLPYSNAEMVYEESVKITLTRNNLKVGDEIVAKVEEGKVIGLDPDNMDQSNLYKLLKINSEKEKDLKQDIKKRGYVLFLCDKRLAFKTVNSIIKTAAMAGFPNFKFTVLQKG